MKWKWANVPIPAQHLIGLIAGAVLQRLLKNILFETAWIGDAIGLPVIAIGIWLAAWAVREASEINIEKPTSLLTTGPYSRSRNPMYVAWTLLHLGVAMVANSLWIAALLPLVVAFTHYFDVRKEERILEEKFGDTYRQYMRRVRRYL